METFHKRLDHLELAVDADINDGNRSIGETINILNNLINTFIQKDEKLVKLFQNLNNSKIRFYFDEHMRTVDEEELEVRKQYVLANLEKIEKCVHNLSILQNMQHSIELDATILTKTDKIVKNFETLQKLELKYNELLIRSVNL